MEVSDHERNGPAIFAQTGNHVALVAVVVGVPDTLRQAGNRILMELDRQRFRTR